MVTSNLMGGLGNLMFQTSSAYSVATDNDDNSIFDTSNSVKVHHHVTEYGNNILRKLVYGPTTVDNHHNEPHFNYAPVIYKPNLKLNGYYQSEKYFHHNRDGILNLFSIDDVSQKYIDEKYGHVLGSGNTCSIHVRRGNYVGLSNIHPPCGLGYYHEAIKRLPSDTVFLVFSDDLSWCRENLNFGNPTHFIEGNPDYIDMWLMSLCDNNITANSSFSWWGAWLNQNPNKKVISPKIWFGPSVQHNTQDLIPESWITI